MEEVLTAKEVAKSLRISVSKVYQLVKDGLLKAGKRKKGDLVRISRQSLYDYLDSKPTEEQVDGKV